MRTLSEEKLAKLWPMGDAPPESQIRPPLRDPRSLAVRQRYPYGYGPGVPENPVPPEPLIVAEDDQRGRRLDD